MAAEAAPGQARGQTSGQAIGQAARLLRVATLNLFHYAEPGVGWLSARAAHTEASLAAKDAWISAQLAEIDADIIGFQEVVAGERLRRLCAGAGYAHFAMVAEPIISGDGSADDPFVYRRAQQAIASRHPMSAAPVEPRESLAKCLSLTPHWEFRRPPVRVMAQTPALGEVVVYCAHLKAPNAGPGDAPIHDPAEEPGRDPMEALSRALAKQAIQRVAEATALYHDAAAALAAAPDRPVFVLGDMNDAPGSATLAALTPWLEDAEDEELELSADFYERYRLIDAARLAPQPLGPAPAAPTHRQGGFGAELDFILVSAALFPWRRGAVGRISERRVHDAHFIAGDPALSSDHAPVSVTVSSFE